MAAFCARQEFDRMGNDGDASALDSSALLPSAKQGQEFIAQVHEKMSRLVQEFASGEINRTQFHKLYDRYQRQIMTVAQFIAESDPTTWRDAVLESEDTLHLKKRLTAKAVGMSVYSNKSGMPIETLLCTRHAHHADRVVLAGTLD
jgi:hypothetical protein